MAASGMKTQCSSTQRYRGFLLFFLLKETTRTKILIEQHYIKIEHATRLI